MGDKKMNSQIKTLAGKRCQRLRSYENDTTSVDNINNGPAPLLDAVITVLTTANRANKLITRDENGKIDKKPGKPISNAVAQTINVPDADSMAAVLRMVADDPKKVIVPSGYLPGTAPLVEEPLAAGEEFHISSMAYIAKHKGINKDCREDLLGWHKINGQWHIARVKDNTLPTNWTYLDRDVVDGTPPHHADMTDEEYIAAMEELVPGLAGVPIVMCPSSTGRVLVDGEPMAASGRHYYFQIQDGSDLERFGATLLQRSFLQGHGFMKPIYSTKNRDEVVGERQWSIFDPSTFSRERIVYEGAPTIRGKGLALAPTKIEIFE
jgi:hypothetical protein